MDLLSRTDKYVFLRAAVPSADFAAFVEASGGNLNHALRLVRINFQATLARMRHEAENPKLERIL